MEISLAGWSINRLFRNQENPFSLLDFPQLSRDEFGINSFDENGESNEIDCKSSAERE